MAHGMVGERSELRQDSPDSPRRDYARTMAATNGMSSAVLDGTCRLTFLQLGVQIAVIRAVRPRRGSLG